MRRASGRTLFAVLMAVALAALAVTVAAARKAPKLTPATVDSAGEFANGDSTTQGPERLSGDGHLYVFSSKAANLPNGDGSTIRSYLHNFKTGKTKIVSTDSAGTPATGEATFPEISPDGKFVAFSGYGTGLPGANGNRQVWVKNLKTGNIRLVSRAVNGDAGDDDSEGAFISANDRFVAFESIAQNLPDPGLSNMIYVRDLKKNTTTMVARTSSGEPLGNARFFGQALSGDGKFLVFRAQGPNLFPADGNTHAYLRNLKSGKTTLLDRAKNGDPPDDYADEPSISLNGRFIAFSSAAGNLPGGCPSFCGYRYDRKTGKLKLVTTTTGGAPLFADFLRLSADGSVIAFESNDPAIVANPSQVQTFAKDLGSGKLTLLSRNKQGQEGNGGSQFPSISADGRFVSFDSIATNLGGNPSGLTVEGYRAGPLP
jgi:Tol biopolymer transport system component